MYFTTKATVRTVRMYFFPTRTYNKVASITVTYDHTLQQTGHPVRSAIHKLQWGGSVVASVTSSEYPLLYVHYSFFFFFFCVALFA